MASNNPRLAIIYCSFLPKCPKGVIGRDFDIFGAKTMNNMEVNSEEKNQEPIANEPQPSEELLSSENTRQMLEDFGLIPDGGEKDIEILELKKQIAEEKDKYLRLYADFDNFRKRNAKERLELILTASKDVIKELLPVLDDFERAMKASETATEAEPVKEGMLLIYNKLSKNLEGKGLKAIEAKGNEFDVALHEAITEVPAPTPDLVGKVMDEVEKGYYLNDKIIRFAKVVVGK